MTNTMTTEERCTRNAISRKLAASAAIQYLFDSHGDERGMDLAATLEREAHDAWRGLGHEDMPTFELAMEVAE